jgi:hypothetical protein
MAYSITTVSPRVLTNVPRPAFRFTDDASVVMATQSADPRYTSSGGGGGGGGGSSVTDALLTEGDDFMITENDDNLQFEG